MTVCNLIHNASIFLKKKRIQSALLDSEIILSNFMKVSRENLLLNDKMKVSKKIKDKFQSAIERRSENEPVAYIVKKKEFWSMDFLVNDSTLVPRPETELLIEKTLKIFSNKKINILDIGTGSGCILLSLLKELPQSKGIGIDISKEALKIATKNSKKLKLNNRAKFIKSDIGKFKSKKFDLVISNPPYINFKDLNSLSKDILKYEPITALNGGIDGLDVIKKVIYKSSKLLKKNGLLAIEIGSNQYKKVSKILGNNELKEIVKVLDFETNVRCIISTKK